MKILKNTIAVTLSTLFLMGMLAGEIIEGKVQSWKDFDDGDQIQVTIDGKTYLTNSTRVVLVAK